MNKSLLKSIDRIPPFLCRIIARKNHGWQPMSAREIAARSGLSKTKVAVISALRSWARVRIDEAEKFAHACGVDLMRPAPHMRWVAKARMYYLNRGTAHQRRMFARMLKG